MAILLVSFILLAPAGLRSAVLTDEDAQTGLRAWQWHEHGVSVRLVQRLPDQTRAFFQARGFTPAVADRIAAACVMQTIFRNDGGRALGYSLDDWVIRHGSASRSMLTREHWARAMDANETSEAARIALNWSLLPTRQDFEPGDYNWGMTSFGLPPGAVFDLEFSLNLDGESIRRKISGIVCAEDRAEN